MLSYEDVKVMRDYVRGRTDVVPKIGVVCGSGLPRLVEMLENPTIIKFEDIPKFPPATVSFHVGQFAIGRTRSGKEVMMQQGRLHLYEGHHPNAIVVGIRLMRLMGVETVIITNAAGGVNQCFSTGDMMIIRDHVYFPGLDGNSPLVGPNDERWGPRFPSLYDLYDHQLREKLADSARELKLDIKKGIYASVAGPHYETAFEIKFLLQNGCDAVGMSTAAEAIAAVHCGMRVVAMSLISNMCCPSLDVGNTVCSHSVVDEVANKVDAIARLFDHFITKL